MQAGGKIMFSTGNLWQDPMSMSWKAPHETGLAVPELQWYTGMEVGFWPDLYCSAVL